MIKQDQQKYIYDILLDIEKKYDLLQFSPGGVQAWVNDRHFIYMGIAEKLGALQRPHTLKDSVLERLIALPSFMKSIICHNPFCSFKKSDMLILDHSRKILYNRQYVDIYTRFFIDKLKHNNKSFAILEEPYLNKHFSKKEKNRYHMDFLLIVANIWARFFPYTFSKEEKTVIEQLSAEIRQKLKLEIDFTKKFAIDIKKFIIMYSLMKRLFRQKKVKQFFVLVGYGHCPHIKAAKDLGIETIELQHGTMTQYHMGYHYPGVPNNSIAYFPDKIYIWDSFWKKMCQFPIKPDKLIVTGFDYLNNEIVKYKNINKTKNQLIVISQGSISAPLADFMLEAVNDMPLYTILYKLHPGEYDRWRENKSLLELSKRTNVAIIDNNNDPLYKLLAESRYLVGVYSTVIFESFNFNCEVILVDLPGISNMEQLINNNQVSLIKNPAELKTIITGKKK